MRPGIHLDPVCQRRLRETYALGGSLSKTYIITWAQNCTRPHQGFLAALKNYPGELKIVRGRYRNPTTPKERPQDWYHADLEPYLTGSREVLCRNLSLYADVPIQPTSANPLNGWEVAAGKHSAIFGHPKRAFKTVPTDTRIPRIFMSTGAVTVENYSQSGAGKKAETHHVLGALVVQIAKDGTYYVRQVSADSRGRFYDLDKRYTPEGVEQADPALGFVLGDIHAGREDPLVEKAIRRLIKELRPGYLFLHDVLDFSSRSHHHDLAEQVRMAGRHVEDEVRLAVNRVKAWKRTGPKIVVVPSNHDDMFRKWLQRWPDPLNLVYWAGMWARGQGRGNPFAQEARRLGLKGVNFLEKRDSDVKLGGVSHKFHGHKGPNGTRGNPRQFAKLGVKTSTGHTHSPGIWDGNYTSGLSGVLDHEYNDLPNGWLQALTVQYADGKRTLVVIVKGRYKC